MEREKIKQVNLKYKTKNYMFDFHQHETGRSLGESIYSCKTSTVEAEEDQSNSLVKDKRRYL